MAVSDGMTVASPVTDGVEQVEPTRPWEETSIRGETPRLVDPTAEIRGSDQVDPADGLPAGEQGAMCAGGPEVLVPSREPAEPERLRAARVRSTSEVCGRVTRS